MNKKIVIKPFYIIFSLYLFMNTFYFIRGYNENIWVIESIPTNIEFSFIQKAYLLFIISMLLIALFYWAINKVNNKRTFYFSDKFGWFTLILQISYLIYNYIFNTNIAGHLKDFSNVNAIDKIFMRLQPDLIFIAIAPALRNCKLFYTNSVIYIISNILRGMDGRDICTCYNNTMSFWRNKNHS